MKEYKVTIDEYGTKYWHNMQGQLHREDGPAEEYANGNKFWWLNDQLHREDGPAIEWADGDKYWYLNGKQLTEEQFNIATKKEITIDGQRYKLVKL